MWFHSDVCFLKLKFMNKYFDLLWKSYGTLEKKNYGTLGKNMILYRKLWNFDLLRKKLWYYGKKTMQL